MDFLFLCFFNVFVLMVWVCDAVVWSCLAFFPSFPPSLGCPRATSEERNGGRGGGRGSDR